MLGERVDELAGWKEKRVFMRKPQYNFGWDWALSLPGLGVFGFVKIEYDFTREIIDYSVFGDKFYHGGQSKAKSHGTYPNIKYAERIVFDNVEFN